MSPARRRDARAILAAGAIAMGACAASVPLPREGTHEGETPVEVSEPPPPPKIEIVPRAPDGLPNAVWIGGQWLWDGKRWSWQDGRWESQADGATYAAPRIVYLAEDKIGWFAGKWRGGTPAGR